ncbi:probable apyrase 4 isoform X2 [Raphanus sativus]|uniref:apyrase n=1 Tax=Raphanus sativus TaxID=3726 RepID=A0A6J0MGW4_RAPSA|nr:probable apyrase 4 isoform X2 [Raphanus sativus]
MQRSHARSRLKNKSDMDPPLHVHHTQPGRQRSSLAKSKCKPTKKSIILVIIGSLAIALALFFVCYTFFLRNRKVSLRYSVVIDGGSSGTRAHVFGYRIESGNPVFDFRGDESYASMKLSPGLSSYADNPEGASVSVKELVEFAKGRVPEGKLKESDIRLMATAGMRLLELSVQERILEVARRVLRSSGFKFQDESASVISGSDEGIYAWVVANHALGSLGGDPLQTTGIVELGGASTQVTFVSSEHVPSEFSRTITYGNVSYRIYSHSFLNLGQDAAHEKLWESLNNLAANSTEKGIVTDPCTPKGYILDKNSTGEGIVLPGESKFTDSLQAAGNFSKCRSAAFTILQEGKEKCPYKHCSIGSTFTPNLRGSFLATENFFHTSKFFGLREKDWLSEMIIAGESFCGDDWSRLKVKHPTFKDESLLRYCFSSAYIVSMLHDSLGVALDDQRVEFASEAGEKGIPLDWALGAFILNTATATSDSSGKSRKILLE